MRNSGRKIRQDIFRCALVQGMFNVASACRKTGISRNTFEVWKRDKRFAKMILEIEEIKKDMFEEALTRVAMSGDSSLLAHIANTKLKDRGYARDLKVNVDVTGQIEHTNTLVLMKDLDLSLDVQKIILNSIRKQRKLVENTVIDDDTKK